MEDYIICVECQCNLFDIPYVIIHEKELIHLCISCYEDQEKRNKYFKRWFQDEIQMNYVVS